MQISTPLQDLGRDWRAARADLKEVIERLSQFLPSHLDVPVYVRRKSGLFAWRRPAPSAPDQWARYRLYFFGIHHYNEFTYRLSIWPPDRHGLPKKLTDRTFADQLSNQVELSFVRADLKEVISPDLPKFVESVFDRNPEDVHPWPLFASDQSFPTYA
jgi:hypothetical protein